MNGLAKQAWKADALAIVAACLLLPQVGIDYVAHFFGTEWDAGTASLIHLHVGVVLAIALVARDRRMLAAGFAAILLGWYVRALAFGQFQWLQAAAVTVDMVVLWWWTGRCARWIGAPFTADRRLGLAGLPKFVVIGLVAFPLGWTALVCAMSLALGNPLPWVLNEGAQQFFAKYIGVACATLPLLLFWTDGFARGTRTRRIAAWTWLGGALLLGLLLERSADPWVEALPAWLFDYRLSVGALLAVAILALSPAWSMPLLSMAHFVLLQGLASLAQGSDDGSDVALLLLHTVELNVMVLLLVGLYLVNRERTQALRQAEHSGRHDAVTGLANAHALQEAWGQLREPPPTLGFLVLDHVDRLASGYGWPAQTAMLRDVARLLAPAMRPYYLGGGQFVLLPGSAGAVAAAQGPWDGVLQLLQHHVFVWRGAEISVTPYLGLVSPQSREPQHLHACVADACEVAMQARQRGETRPVAMLDDVDATLSTMARREKFRATSDALACVRSGRIELHVQPIVRIDGGPVVEGLCGEVLCRLRGRDGELIAPAHFIAELEAGGHVAELDLAVVESLFGILREDPALSRSVARLGINLSGSSLSSDSFRSRLVELLQQSPIRHEALCFELTETAVISRFSSATRLFLELRAMGCRMALDDFGSGTQNFERLRQLPVDIVKIDGQFVRNVAARGSDYQIVQAAVSVARAHGLVTVAEYVENIEILHCLQEMGIEWGQGYHLGFPRPMSEFARPAA